MKKPMLKDRAIEESRERFLSGIGVPKLEKFIVDDFQRQAIDNLAAGIDTLVVAPTGSGKTFIAIEAMRNLIKKGQHAVYTTPLKALSNTKYTEFQRIFAPDHTVGLLTGDRKIEGDSDVVIATTEIYRNELYRGTGRYSLVILDEVHYIADPQRGAVWEESIILTPHSSTLLMLSASISNAEEIAAWIEETRNKECRIVMKKDRPVELRYGFLHPQFGVIPLSDEKGHLSPEVAHFYGSASLDDTGTRVTGRFGRGEGRGDRGARGGGGRGGRGGRGQRGRDGRGQGRRSR
jgi:ATP-dependent RNA helicase HelY